MQYQLVTLQKRYAAFLEILKKTPFFAEKRTKNGDFCPFLAIFQFWSPVKQKIFSNSKKPA